MNYPAVHIIQYCDELPQSLNFPAVVHYLLEEDSCAI